MLQVTAHLPQARLTALEIEMTSPTRISWRKMTRSTLIVKHGPPACFAATSPALTSTSLRSSPPLRCKLTFSLLVESCETVRIDNALHPPVLIAFDRRL